MVLMLYLLQNYLSIKLSVALGSIIALIVTCLVVPCSRFRTIIWSFLLFSVSVLFSAAYRFLISMGFGLVLPLRLLPTGDFRRFPTLLPACLIPPSLLLWLVVSIAFCCPSSVPRLLLLCCWPGSGMPPLNIQV